MHPEIIVPLITETAKQHGYAGVAIAMFLQGIIQVIPAYLILPPVGYMAAQGKLDLTLLIGAGFTGAMGANIVLYQVGRYMNTLTFSEDYEGDNKYIIVAINAYNRSKKWFDRYGSYAVFWCRLIPLLRTMISVVAGIELMNRKKYLMITAAGTFLYTSFLVLTGWSLKNGWTVIAEIQRPLLKLFLPFAIMSLLWWISVYAAERYTKLIGAENNDPESRSDN